MIKNSKALNLAEVKKMLEEQEKSLKEQKEEKQEKIETALSYAKRFSKLSAEKLKHLKEDLKKLDIMQLKDRHIIKIADLLPVDAGDLHKILSGEDTSLDKNEIDKILELIKKHTK